MKIERRYRLKTSESTKGRNAGTHYWVAYDAYDKHLCSGPIRGFKSNLKAEAHAAHLFGSEWTRIWADDANETD